MLVVEGARPTIDDILSDPWLSGVLIPAAPFPERVPLVPAPKEVVEIVEESVHEEEEPEPVVAKKSNSKVLKPMKSSSISRKREREEEEQKNNEKEEEKEEDEKQEAKAEPEFTQAQLKKLKVVDLKAMLKEKSLSQQGRKDELIARLLGK